MKECSSFKLLKDEFKNYKPPKELRALFIIHYMPLLLIVLIGPLTPLTGIWKIPILPELFSVTLGIITLLLGSYIYLRWEMHWTRVYHGQLVTSGIFTSIRHPHYTSLIILGFGLALFFYSSATLIIATIAVPVMIASILDEEKLLLKQYGESYKKFMDETPYRIIPRIF